MLLHFIPEGRPGNTKRLGSQIPVAEIILFVVISCIRSSIRSVGEQLLNSVPFFALQYFINSIIKSRCLSAGPIFPLPIRISSNGKKISRLFHKPEKLGASMKVALIAPPYPLEEAPSAPLGLCYVAAAFESVGAKVKIFDYIVRRYTPEKLIYELGLFDPDIIGTTSVTMNFEAAAFMLKTAKAAFPRAVVMMGGPHVSFDYENTLRKYPEIDIIVVGEGEQTIVEMMRVIEDKKAWKKVCGVAFREGDTVVFTGERELIRDIDSLPFPARHLLPMSRYLAMGFPISIITSRGCPNRCIFCQGRRMVGSRIRSRNPQLVVDEIENLLAYGFERINFSDDFFTSNARRVKEICRKIHDRGLKFSWTVFARADSVDVDMLTVMRNAGCDTVFFGIESGNQEMLNRVRKRLKLDRIRKAVADCKAVGMTVFGSFIAGLPGESMDTLMDSHHFAQELDIIYGYHFLAPFPGTDVMDHMAEYDIELLSRDWPAFDANRAIVRTSHLTAEEIEKFVQSHYLEKTYNDDLDTEKRFREGRLTPAEKLVFLGKKKLGIVYKLFAEDIIETLPRFPVSDSDDFPVKKLADEITPVMDGLKEFVLPSLQHLVDRGYLASVVTDNHRVWQWA
jgi:anaerobic magnesium-protoporphyrin IX monomethyl ester cyclase